MGEKEMCKNINEVTHFWKGLWEEESTMNRVLYGRKSQVPPQTKESRTLEPTNTALEPAATALQPS